MFVNQDIGLVKNVVTMVTNDPNITLNEDNLQLLCEECHNSKRRTEKDIEDGLRFDEFGNLVKSPLFEEEK